MEVHLHPHHVLDKKKWPEYLLEFLMIFLAVFLGFIAENIRERRFQKEIGRRYVESFYKDLKTDIYCLDSLIRYDSSKINALKSMYNCYDSVSRNFKATDCMFRLIHYSRGFNGFVSEERTVKQLENSGGYNLLNKDDADGIINYNRAYTNMAAFENSLLQESQDNVRNTLTRLASFKLNIRLQAVTKGIDESEVPERLPGELLFSDDAALLNQWFNQLALYSRAINIHRNLMIAKRDTAILLLKFYDSKYHFEKSK